ncbi:Meiotic coiled-coil protein 2 [Wallemia ichthyophaga EXF-994]|uniref:Meiotic coiled-coil protein 2 n=1 Tax=Wallemia ichthyophaga (strain EXF-994 / CBS 113033) TaxID=1299270 RepID=R9ANW2_WALI9|nr:Meiotic coiled-coil protein 2 [Wallemia ichthyophaga EXF-994]EOR01771.1 Meiotic coiled-coil protein 2 [Wallemia ichthyophaga EXF-994]
MFYDDDIDKIWSFDGRNSSFKSLNSAWPAVLSAPPAVVLNTRNSNLNFREMLKPNSDVNYAGALIMTLVPLSHTSNHHIEVVQRIIIKTDQQASIFLQQKLKSLERPQLDLLVDAVLNRALPLSTNRFGNFLIQRILDVEDISYKLRIVNAISGQIEGVAMNSYGTHVLQKLLATSPEHVKAGYIMNKNVAQGVTHKNASHVWSKALEIKWLIYTPHIMPTVNAAMKGRWVHCANTDTGSLIIQSILGKDGAGACFNEILDNITSCALNKWGSTVVQYLIERASESSLARVTTLLIYSYKQLSVDFYGARCLMACLTMGRKNEYAVELLSRLLLNDAETIFTIKVIVDSSIGAQFLVNILSLMTKNNHHRLLTLIHSAKELSAGVEA